MNPKWNGKVTSSRSGGLGGIRTHDLRLRTVSLALPSAMARLPDSTTSPTTIDWEKFNEYLNQNFAPCTQREYRRNARLYSRVLTTGDASPLLSLSDCRRRH